jgi:bacteriocin-like protein
MKNFKELSNEQMNAVKGGESTIMGFGTDGWGDYVIIDDGNSCKKVYTYMDQLG